ncbi:MAG TPA: translocation/assembly module TamB domain-containing protein, partial [Nannocystaceae bacterium]|nr:translocation/assembly module TamB domain-containing protein [Nannocystaceae bacterium]
AELGKRELHAHVQASGPAVRLLELELTVPLDVDFEERSFAWRRTDPHALQLALADVDLGTLGRLANVGGIAGRIDGEAELEGTAAAPKLVVDLTGRELAFAGHPLGALELGLEHRRGRVRASVRQTRGVEHVALDADLPIAIDLTDGGVAWDRQAPHRIELDAVAVDEQLIAAFVELPDDFGLELNAELHARGNVDTLTAMGQVRARLDTGEGVGTPLAAHLAVSPAQQTVDVVIGPFEDSAVTLVATTQAPLRALLGAEKSDWRKIPIVASFDAEHFPMRGLDPLLPEALDRPDGRLDAHVGVAGTLQQPNLKGRIALHDAALTVVPLRQRFEKIGLDLALDRQDIRLARFTAKSGAGRATAKGNLHLARGDTAGRLDVTLAGLPIVRPGMPLMKLSTRATAELDARGERTEIDVVARRTTLDVFTTSATAPAELPTTEGIVFVDARGRTTRKRDETKPTPADAREPLLPPSMRVRMKLGDPIFVRGPQANMTWRGSVEIERDAGEKIRATGSLTADRGRINFLGHDFIIDSGRVTLPERGELDPYIAVTAVTQTPEGDVNIDVHGRASKPQLRLSSDPPLPESDVFALLVTGSSEGADKGEGGEVEAKAANLLVAFENPVLQRELQDRLGIDRVGVTFGDTVDQPIVAVGKRVSRKIYLETRYHHNAPKTQNTAEIHLEYTIKAPHWSVETFFGDAAKGGVELWWRKRFGRPPPPAATAQDKSNRREGRW